MQLQILSRGFFNFSSTKSLEHAVIAIQGINKINSSSFQAKSQFGAVANAPAHFGLCTRVLAAAVRLGRVFLSDWSDGAERSFVRRYTEDNGE